MATKSNKKNDFVNNTNKFEQSDNPTRLFSLLDKNARVLLIIDLGEKNAEQNKQLLKYGVTILNIIKRSMPYLQ